jgi:hypothetical protein
MKRLDRTETRQEQDSSNDHQQGEKAQYKSSGERGRRLSFAKKESLLNPVFELRVADSIRPRVAKESEIIDLPRVSVGACACHAS